MICTSLSFDATVTVLFPALTKGLTLHLLPEGEQMLDALQQIIVGHQTPLVFKLTPAHLLGIELPQVSEQPHLWVIGGEQLTADHLKAATRRLPNARLINEFGPTETTVGCSWHCVSHDEIADSAPAQPISIGVGLPDTQLLILDHQMNLVPHGATGELYVGGEGVAKGYLNRDNLSAERFVGQPLLPGCTAAWLQTPVQNRGSGQTPG